MKKIVGVLISSMLLIIFSSCNTPSQDLSDKDIDLISDLDTIADADETSEDDIETVDESDEPDEDINDFDNESDTLSFKTRPHGITRWDEEYSYFIRCESQKDLETVISVSKDDTCKGTIKSDTYTFTPTKTKFPEGRCSIAVECSNGKDLIAQTTQIMIPNPIEFPGPVAEKLTLKILWANSQRAIFIYENRLLSINSNLDSIEEIDSEILEVLSSEYSAEGYYFSKDDFFYYVSKDFKNIVKTDGTVANTTKIEIPGEKRFLSIYLVTENENMILFSRNSENYTLSFLYYDLAQTMLTTVETPEDFNDYSAALCDVFTCVFSSAGKFPLIFQTAEKIIEPICPLIQDIDYSVDAFLNGKIYYRKNSEKCLTSLDISSCVEEKIGDCDSSSYTSIIYEKGKNFFHTVFRDSGKILITLFLSDGSIKSATYDNTFYAFETQDGIHLFVNDPYKCQKILNLEDGTAISPELLCNHGEAFKFSGFFGEDAFFNKLYAKLTNQVYSIKNDGAFSEKLIQAEIPPSKFTLSVGTGLNENDLLFITTQDSTQIFETDGTIENTKHITNAPGEVISVSETQVITYFNSVMNIYSLETDELIFSTPALTCVEEVWPIGTFVYRGVKNYWTVVDGLFFFGVTDSESCGRYHIWTTDGTLAGTINHEISLDDSAIPSVGRNVYPDQENGMYIVTSWIYYIKDKKKAVDTKLSGYKALGFINGGFIAYKEEYERIKEIVTLKNGEIFDITLFSEEQIISNISISNNAIQLLETVTINGESVTNVICFPEGDLNKKPVTAELFGGHYHSVSKIAENGNLLIYSVEIPDTAWFGLKSVVLNDDSTITVSEPFYYYWQTDEFKALTINGNNLILSEDSFLSSLPVDCESENVSQLFDIEGYSQYDGNTFSGEAVVEHSDWNNTEEFLIVTDGNKKTVKKIKKNTVYSLIDIWNSWIMEDTRRFIVEEEENTLKSIEIFESSFNNVVSYKSARNIYFAGETDGLEEAFFVYHLPKTE